MKHTVKEIELSNGAKGLFINVPGATVMDYEFNFRAGDYLVPREKWEVPHLMEHMLLGANERIPKARAFNAELEKNGAYCNAHTSTYHVTYESECADFEWQRVLDLMLVAISKPLFLPGEFKAEFGNVRDERASRSNNHFLHLSAVTRQAYGLISMPDREALRLMRNVRLRDLKEHYARTHVTSNLRFIVAGDLKGRQAVIKKAIENIDLPKGRGRLELPTEKPQPLDAPVFVLRPSVRTLHFYIDIFTRKRFDDPQWDALILINSMLTATLHSRILGEARERGLVYSVGSNLDVTKDSSLWWFAAQVIPKNALALFGIITTELQRVRRGEISRQDIINTKQYLLGRYQRGGQTVGGVLAGYSGRYYFDDVIEDYNAIPARIKTVSKNDITTALEQMFGDKIGGLGVLGNAKSKELVEQLNSTLQPLWQ